MTGMASSRLKWDLLGITLGLVGLASFLFLPPALAWPTPLLTTLAFALYIGITIVLGIPVSRQPSLTFGLVNVVIIATFLCLGLAPAILALILGVVIAEAGRQLLADHLGHQRRRRWHLFVAVWFNSGMLVLSLLAGAGIFQWLGGRAPLDAVSSSDVLPLAGLILGFFFANQLGIALYLKSWSTPALAYFRQHALKLLTVELIPQSISPLIALVYFSLPPWASWLSAIALLTAALLTNRLVYARRRLEQQLEKVSTLNAISHQVTASLDLERVFKTIVDAMVPLIGCQRAGIFVLDETGGAISLVRAYGLSDEFMRQAQSLAVETVRALAVRQQTPVLVEDVERVAEFAPFRKLTREEGIRAFADVPMRSRGRVIGVLTAYFDHVHRFSPDEMDLLTALANQAAIAVDNARLYAHTDAALNEQIAQLSAKNRQLASVLEVGNALRADLGLDDVLDQIVKSVVNSLGFRVAILSLVEQDSEPMLRQVAAAGIDHKTFRRLRQARAPLDRFLALMEPRLQLGRAYFIPHTEGIAYADLWGGEAYTYAPDAPQGEDETWHPDDVLFVPLLGRRNELVGILSVDDPVDGRIPSQETIEALTIFANHASAAIETATLFSTIQQHVAELSILHKVGLELASSFDLTQVLDVIAESALNLVTADDIHIFLYDEQTGQVTFGTSLWADGRTETPYRNPRPEGLTYTVAQTGQPLVINDPAHHPLFTRPDAAGWQVDAIAGFPLKYGDEVVGVFNVAFITPHTFTEDELRLLRLLGSQAAIAISNARLFRQVQEGRDQLEAILNSTQDGILLFDPQGRILVANPMIEELTGLTRHDLIGRDLNTLGEQFGAEAQTLIGYTPEALRQIVADLEREPRTVLKDKVETNRPIRRVFERIVAPVQEQRGAVLGYVMVLHDVTEGQELAEMRDDLTHMIVHDLRTPLSTIIGSLNVLAEIESDDSNLADLVSVASNSSQRMLNLVNSLLDIAALEAGQLPLRRDTYDLVKLVESAVERMQPLARSDNVRIEMTVPSDSPPVDADADLVVRVLANLLDNALKFSPEGSVVRLAVSPVEEGGGVQFVRCAVHDQGPGIPLGERDHIFEKFSQVKGRRGRRRGSGLGLTFCKLAVEAHGGDIWIEDPPGGGSRFVFTLPVAG